MNSIKKVDLSSRLRNICQSQLLYQQSMTIGQRTRRFCHNLIPKLSASPEVALQDVIPVIKVTGLSNGAPVTLEAEMFDDNGKQLLSNAHYQADKNGEVDVTFDSSVGGSYKGIFPTGLISTMKLAGGSFEYGRVVKENLEIPLKIKISLKDGHEFPGSQNRVLDTVELQRYCIGPGVKTIQVKSGRIRGILFIPAGEGPFPGVIDLFGATGTFVPTRAALMASRGIAALAMAYFNYDDIPEEKIFDLDLEYFEEGTEYLMSQPGVIPDRCGVIGSCVGGSIANYMGICLEKVKAIYGINFPVKFFFPLSYNGKALYKAMDSRNVDFKVMYKHIGDNVFAPTSKLTDSWTGLNGSFSEIMHKAEHKHFAYVQAEDDSCKFINGTKKLVDSLSEKQRRNVTFHTCPKAGHIIDAPYNRVIRNSYMKLWSKDHNSPSIVHSWGGEALGDVQMQEYIWEKLFKFFNSHIRDESLWYQSYLSSKKC